MAKMTKSKYPSQTDVKTVRISPETHDTLKALALEWSMPIGQVVGQLAQFAIEGELRPQITLKQANNKGGH